MFKDQQNEKAEICRSLKLQLSNWLNYRECFTNKFIITYLVTIKITRLHLNREITPAGKIDGEVDT